MSWNFVSSGRAWYTKKLSSASGGASGCNKLLFYKVYRDLKYEKTSFNSINFFLDNFELSPKKIDEHFDILVFQGGTKMCQIMSK